MSTWIKMTTNLSTHPKVVRISSDLNADRLKIVGGLHAVWSTFDQHSADGMLENYTPKLLDSIVGWKGFAGALISVGWLIEVDNSLMLKDFEDHNGKSAKERSQNAKRMSNTRLCGKSADSKRTKPAPDKIREDKSISKDIPPIVPTGDGEEEKALNRARALFRMRESTPLDKAQTAAWKAAKAIVMDTSDEEWAALEAVFNSTDPDTVKYRKQNLSTLLNQWNDSVIRAKKTAAEAVPQDEQQWRFIN
jgi:hypothetical protein